MAHVASFAISLGPIFWLLNAFWFYGLIGLLTLAFCWKFVPETKGRRLENIQEYFEQRAASSAPASGGG